MFSMNPKAKSNLIKNKKLELITITIHHGLNKNSSLMSGHVDEILAV